MKNFLLAIILLGFVNLSYSQIEDERHPLYLTIDGELYLKTSPETMEKEINVHKILREREPNFSRSNKNASFEENLRVILSDNFMINDNYIFESVKEKASSPKTTKNHLNDAYHDAVSLSSDCDRISSLETLVANYDVTKQSFYDEKLTTYKIDFKEGDKKDGVITAVFDTDGNLVKSLERFKNIRLPRVVLDAINDVYPGAIIKTNTYVVSYNENSGTNKIYKVKIDANGNTKSLKVDSNGKFI
ncbi:hypothetical protein [Aestuariibaculum suncheonense]|uniref:Uncharacterized protein n=1 Tax=Aestuariibaculum suncheonense TaxID=1028745 RepID=A0A8J6UGK4_9FLAO|nr:hypothetical protein [Aestuariibaculum suncheonense]MBD0835139.1 hypothetical protein [Aestuariibaculum suncheonense]